MRVHRLILLIIFVGLFGLWTVWQQVQTVRTGYKCDAARRRIETLRNEQHQLQFQVARLRSPEALMAKKAAFALDLSDPTGVSLVSAKELKAIVAAAQSGAVARDERTPTAPSQSNSNFIVVERDREAGRHR
ncbi:MAG: hypothetical protein RDV41_14610 [Planctomycetota bacterium]|nr:hypothetical protein [Planctomycetota bacterium]